jgi:hypothetical protein
MTFAVSTQINLTYCGMPASGRTVKEAKQEAARKIESALSGSYSPRFLRHADMLAFVWREPMSGFVYRIVYADSNAGALYGNGGAGDDEITATRAAARHMAQNAGHYLGIESYLTDADRRELDRYFDWQARYSDAKARGLSDDDCRSFADQRP